ncbi:MAG: PRC-barrel domain-containing protein [Caldilineaceae bacterium]
MDIPINVEVHCVDGLAGHSSCIILNPLTRIVTHFVLHRQTMFGGEVLVPVALIKESTPDLILLRCQLHELATLEPFNKGHFLGYKEDEISPNMKSGRIMAWPYAVYAGYGYGYPGATYVLEEQIPLDECTIHRGSQVEATDGWVGKVNEFLVNPENSHITHLVLRENHFWGDKAVTIPVSEIAKIETDVVRLKLSRKEVTELPHLQIQ